MMRVGEAGDGRLQRRSGRTRIVDLDNLSDIGRCESSGIAGERIRARGDRAARIAKGVSGSAEVLDADGIGQLTLNSARDRSRR